MEVDDIINTVKAGMITTADVRRSVTSISIDINDRLQVYVNLISIVNNLDLLSFYGDGDLNVRTKPIFRHSKTLRTLASSLKHDPLNMFPMFENIVTLEDMSALVFVNLDYLIHSQTQLTINLPHVEFFSCHTLNLHSLSTILLPSATFVRIMSSNKFYNLIAPICESVTSDHGILTIPKAKYLEVYSAITRQPYPAPSAIIYRSRSDVYPQIDTSNLADVNVYDASFINDFGAKELHKLTHLETDYGRNQAVDDYVETDCHFLVTLFMECYKGQVLIRAPVLEHLTLTRKDTEEGFRISICCPRLKTLTLLGYGEVNLGASNSYSLFCAGYC